MSSSGASSNKRAKTITAAELKRLQRILDKQKLNQKKFLKAYTVSGSVWFAASEARIGRSTHYHWMKTDQEYAKAFEEAQDECAERLEAEANKRATSGPKPSDVLLMFLLKGLKPHKYRDRYDMNVSGGLAHTGQIVIQLPPTDDN